MDFDNLILMIVLASEQLTANNTFQKIASVSQTIWKGYSSANQILTRMA